MTKNERKKFKKLKDNYLFIVKADKIIKKYDIEQMKELEKKLKEYKTIKL